MSLAWAFSKLCGKQASGSAGVILVFPLTGTVSREGDGFDGAVAWSGPITSVTDWCRGIYMQDAR